MLFYGTTVTCSWRNQFCLAAYGATCSALLEDSMATSDVPSHLYSFLVDEPSMSALQFDKEMRENLADIFATLPIAPSECIERKAFGPAS